MPTTRSGRSNSNAKNNDLSRFTKYSILTADLFYIYRSTYQKQELRLNGNNLGELITNTGDILLRAKNYGARIKARVHSL